ncbi:CCA tRNA nucleotidyltransferase [Beijerinckia sp. L45]|uniref:CCA tRNA nucleotidyltransferase n=1 Tax=Beijerinckia sp. L45 TaxID=1641855 RepID=UPI00131DD015|nr:CCA tRNA nucleotidyltransferase [Beijerinckia sp. L45]
MTSQAASLLGNPALRQALELLNGDGEEARVVGGAVRNALLGRPVHEFDIATTATPDVVVARAENARLRSIPTGIAHGTVTVLVGGVPFEITTLREDVETDGRHAVIRFGRDFVDDARRRDFTINALSMGLDGQVHDYTGGLADLAARRVRFIGDAGQRIREDFLRVLRFFRFSADYADGPLDAEGLAAAIRERAGLAILSRERIRQELLKLLVARRAAAVVAVISECGLLGPLLHGVAQPARLSRLLRIDPEADGPLRLAALGVQISEDAERLRMALRLSNQEAARLDTAAKALVALHGIDLPPPIGDLRTMLFRAGRQGACDALRLAQAESRAAASDSAWSAALRFLRDTPEPHMPFSGADLMARGFSGRALGEALKNLQAQWIRAGFPQDSRTLAALLDDVGKSTPS